MRARCQSVFEIPVGVGREPSGISWPPRTGGLAPIRYNVFKNALASSRRAGIAANVTLSNLEPGGSLTRVDTEPDRSGYDVGDDAPMHVGQSEIAT